MDTSTMMEGVAISVAMDDAGFPLLISQGWTPGNKQYPFNSHRGLWGYSSKHLACSMTLYFMNNIKDPYDTEEVGPMTLLLPDRAREQREDFVWCLPVERQKWNKWYALSKQFNTATPDGVRYFTRMEGTGQDIKVRTVVMMPNESQSDDDVVAACAYLRLIEQMTCRMYIIRSTDQKLTTAQMIYNMAGADPKTMEEIPDGEEGSIIQ